MLSKSLNIFNSFLAHRLTRQVRELYSATLILDLAVSMVSIFEPVFLYVFFSKSFNTAGALESVIYFYLSLYILYFFLVPLGAKFARRFGYENSIALASLFQIVMYFSLFSMTRFSPVIILAVIAYAIAKSLYWPAYHANFARFSSDGERGRELSNLYALESFIFVIGPLIGGLILNFFGFRVLFISVSILILASNIPMLITKEKFEPRPFLYWQSFKRLFNRENRKKLFGYWGYGEEWIVLVLWPIFMYLAAEDFLGLGIIAAVSTFLATLILLFIGRLTDKSDKNKLLKFGVMFYFFGWLFRILARTYFGIMLIDVYSRVTKNSISLPITAELYQNAQSHSVMKTIVFFESALILGKLMAMVLCWLALQLFVPGWNSFFILAAGLSLFYLMFKYYDHGQT